MRPSEVAITLAVVSAAHAGGYPHKDAGWVPADIVRGRLSELGFTATTQQVAAWLGSMARSDQPWVEQRQSPFFAQREYRATHYGITDVRNNLPGWQGETPWLPVYRGGVHAQR